VYVCICNALTEDEVRRCVAAGACSTRQVKKACGWKPGCGACVSRIAGIVGEMRDAPVTLELPAA
jgi:bacterioferritin-associated ferredoxin